MRRPLGREGRWHRRYIDQPQVRIYVLSGSWHGEKAASMCVGMEELQSSRDQLHELRCISAHRIVTTLLLIWLALGRRPKLKSVEFSIVTILVKKLAQS